MNSTFYHISFFIALAFLWPFFSTISKACDNLIAFFSGNFASDKRGASGFLDYEYHMLVCPGVLAPDRHQTYNGLLDALIQPHTLSQILYSLDYVDQWK